jgi:hypothetical protein
MSTSLLKKYECDKLSEVVGNKRGIKLIKDWLNNYHASKVFLAKHGLLKKSTKGRKRKMDGLTDHENCLRTQKGNLLIMGGHGTGKTMTINLILKEMGYHSYYFSSLENKNKINMKRLLQPDKKCVLVIDELESIIVLNDKKSVSSLIVENNYMRTMPIIVLTNNQHNKQLNETKKHSDEIKIYSPYPNEIYGWISKICIKERIKFDYGALNDFLTHCKNDLRKILIELNNLKILFKDKIIKKSDIDNFRHVIDKKNMDVMLYKDTEEILTGGKTDIDKCLGLYESEKILIPLMIHENYHKFIKQEKYSKILDILSMGDIIDNYIHSGQNWDLSTTRAMISTVVPSHLINKYQNTSNKCKKLDYANPNEYKLNKNSEDADADAAGAGDGGGDGDGDGDNKKSNTNNDADDEDKLVFATDLNRTSVKKMNSKNTKITNKEINKHSKSRNKSVDEFLYLGDIIKGNPSLNIEFSSNILKINRIK